jgi:hypothetical protein
VPCNPSDTHISLPTVPGIPLAPFGGIPISAIQLPIPNLNLPNIESVLDLINEFSAILPGGTFKPQLADGQNTILIALMNLLNQLAPYLSIYNFFQAAFDMILCIINVLCSLLAPWKLFKALRKLFKQCIPKFMSLFPFIALLAMIISLLLLIIALIEYIIATVEKIIEDLIANLTNLGEGLTLQNDDAVAATAKKIAQLLCLMENLFAVLVAIGAIINIINSLAGMGGNSVCGGSQSDDDCCSDDFCAPFIADNPNGITGSLGELIYYHTINTDIRGIFGSLSAEQASQFNLPSLRTESWQFVNQSTSQPYPFVDIIIPLGSQGNIFWPENSTFNESSATGKVPYTLNLTINEFNPGVFNPSDHRGSRQMVINNVIVSKKPYIGVVNQDNNIDTSINQTGTLSLVGGLAYEVSETLGQIPYIVNGAQATIETLIHNNPMFGNLPSYDDGYIIGDVDFTLNVNYTALIGYGLITLGCHPDLFVERFIANQRVGSFDAIAVRLPPVTPSGGFLPDVSAAQACLTASMAKLRASVTPEAVAEFQAEINACLTQLKDETSASYCNILKAAVSIYESTIILNTDVEFVTRTITATVQLFDPNGTLISSNISADCVPTMSELLKGFVTFGAITDFVYDGISSFTAQISATSAGGGFLTVTYDGNTLKRILNADDNTVQTVSEDNTLPYQFINTNVISKVSGAESGVEFEETVSRDAADIAKDGSE